MVNIKAILLWPHCKSMKSIPFSPLKRYNDVWGPKAQAKTEVELIYEGAEALAAMEQALSRDK